MQPATFISSTPIAPYEKLPEEPKLPALIMPINRNRKIAVPEADSAMASLR